MNRPSWVRLLVTFLAVGAAWSPAAAQDGLPAGQGQINGTITSSEEEGRPLVNAAVELRAVADSSLVTGMVTDHSGQFRLDGLNVGQYYLRVTLLGYAPFTTGVLRVSHETPVASLGMIALVRMAVELDGVEVSVERAPIVFEIDRTVYNSRSFGIAAGGSARDVFRILPELEVDLTGRVRMRGNASVAIHLNGRPLPFSGEMLSTFLEQLSADRIDRVEVITNPSVAQDPEGMGGIVNVVLRQDASLGLAGALSLSIGSRGSSRLGSRVAYQRGRLLTFIGISGTHYDEARTSFDLRENLLAEPISLLEQYEKSQNRRYSGYLDISTEFRVGAFGVLWGSATGLGSDASSDAMTTYRWMDSAHVPWDHYRRSSLTNRESLSGDFSVGYRHIVRPRRQEFSIEARRVDSSNENLGEVIRESLALDGSLPPTPGEWRDDARLNGDERTSFRVDLTREVFGDVRLELGYRGQLRRRENDHLLGTYLDVQKSEVEKLDVTDYVHSETYHQAFALVGGQLGRVGIQAGVRGETAGTKFLLDYIEADFPNNYRTVFPSGNLSFQQGGSQIRVSYAKRIARPGPSRLNPYTPARDPLNLEAGNPYLLPQLTHSFNGSVSQSGQVGSVQLSGYYRRSANGWEQIRNVSEGGVSTLRWENVSAVESLGVDLTVSLSSTERLGGYLSGGAYRERRDAGALGPEFSGSYVGWYANGSLSWRLTDALETQWMAQYTPPQEIPQGRISGTIMTDFGATQRFLGDRARVTLWVSDPLKLWSYSFETHDRSHVQTSQNTYSARSVRISVQYSFGRSPNERGRQRGVEEEEVEGPTIRIR